MHQGFTDNRKLALSIKVEELKKSLHYTGVDYRDSDIRLIKDGYVIATISVNEKDKEQVQGICYFCTAKLIRAEIYTNGLSYVEYFKTARSKSGLYAKLTRRTFCNENGSVAYDQIFENEKEWYLFPDGRRRTKPQFMVEFVKSLNLSGEDVVLIDSSVPDEFMHAIFTFGKATRIVAIIHAGGYFMEKKSDETILRRFPYNWFLYAVLFDTMVASTALQKEMLERKLKEYH